MFVGSCALILQNKSVEQHEEYFQHRCNVATLEQVCLAVMAAVSFFFSTLTNKMLDFPGEFESCLNVKGQESQTVGTL